MLGYRRSGFSYNSRLLEEFCYRQDEIKIVLTEFKWSVALADEPTDRFAFRAATKRTWRCTRERLARAALCTLMVLSLSPRAESQKPALITSIKVIAHKDKIELRIEADHALSLQSMVLTHPHRIVLDASGAVFKTEKIEIPNNACPVKSVHTNFLKTRSPVARIVVATCTPPIFTLHTEGNLAFLEITSQSVPRTYYPPVETSDVRPHVTFDQGLLSIVADNSTLRAVLRTVERQIGARIEFPDMVA